MKTTKRTVSSMCITMLLLATSAASTTSSCTSEQKQCNGLHSLLSCKQGVWVESPCDPKKFCKKNTQGTVGCFY
ncbi:hypothetical protein AX774_g4765 [Zancudomyces culisetae]|uniref:Carbohydrate-binding module family 19 domain-containing protein n=1 Tax=Zancudomyces culisetae TaxID=1213189 RepID=A0A1R1PLE0_ZANCU|nr:hypothetical protein AX774_g4765 [Zancudomyces culisetae]|eukprot:OMH81775.1 hypothetical protein AX774_g4765 [Zancudomyces culisetae]